MKKPAVGERAKRGSTAGIIAELPAKPHALLIDPDNIPPELKALPQWVVWQYQWNGEKWTKPPLDAKAALKGKPKKASSTDPKTWATFERALEAYEMHPPMAGDVFPPSDPNEAVNSGLDGIGFIPLQNDNICGIDVDNCIDDNGQLNAMARDIVNTMQTYTELSPSGRGIRLWCYAKKPAGRSKNGDVEMYDGVTKEGKQGGRYLTVTGNLL